MKRKSDIVREAIATGELKKALRLAKNFRINVTAAQREVMARAYECLTHPEFFRQIGTDIPKAVGDGVEVLKSLYGA